MLAVQTVFNANVVLFKLPSTFLPFGTRPLIPGKANIVVYGGKFYDFDPHNNTAEGPNTNFCAEGYTTVSEEIDGHIVYTVIKE